MRPFSRLLTLVALMAVPVSWAIAAEREPIVVFAAASLTDALQAASDAYTKATGTPIKLSFAASSALAKQIESGARADVFFPADQQWMEYLDGKKLIRRESRVDLLGNRLALIAPADSKAAVKLSPGAPIAPLLGKSGRLATGDPDSVPVGVYAKAALTSLGQWAALESRLVRADNVRVALMYVVRGEAALGIVYATDANAEPRVKVLDLFPESSHPPITYPIALTSTAKPGAAGYVQFLKGEEASAVFSKAGFRALSAAASARKGCEGFRFDALIQVSGSTKKDVKLVAS
jgi:molybdate transport system substrate-binding protein